MAYDATMTDPAAIQSAMKANSDAYASSDLATQDQLHKDNLSYATKTGQTYNSGAGTFSNPTASTNVAYPTTPPPTGSTNTTPTTTGAGSASTPFSTIMGTQSTTPPSTTTGLGTQSDGSLHLNVNGQSAPDVKVFKGTSFDSARDLASQLGLPYTADPKTGEISIGGTKVSPTSYDKNGEAIVGIRNVADALGYKIEYDKATGTVTVTGKNTQAPVDQGQVQQMQPMYNSPVQSIYNGMPQQQPITPWQQPDVSGYQQNMMPYQNFNPDWANYYNQAHNQLDPQFDTNNQKLMDKQNLDINNMNESMNKRGIYSSGVAQAAEDDLRAKTTNAIAQGFTAQMAQIEKQAQTLYQDAVKQAQTGNDFALKNNEYYTTQMLNVEKQSFTQWLSTQKLDQSQYNYAIQAWDKMSGFIMTDAKNQLDAQKSLLPYEYQTANNAADNATSQSNNAANNATSASNNANNNNTSMAKALLPYQAMTQYQQATTQEKSQMDAAVNYFKQQGINIDTAKLMESIRHNQSTEDLTASGQQITKDHNAATEANANNSLLLRTYEAFGYGADGKTPTVSRATLDNTIAHDNALINDTQAAQKDTQNKTSIEALGKELTSINNQITDIYNNPSQDKTQQTANIQKITDLGTRRDALVTDLSKFATSANIPAQ